MGRMLLLSALVALCAPRALSFVPIATQTHVVTSARLSNHARSTALRATGSAAAKPFFVDIIDTETNMNTKNMDKSSKTNIIAGATGYIGRAVVAESVKQGYNTVCLVRNATYLSTPEGIEKYGDSFAGATVVQADIEDANELTDIIASISTESGKPILAVISCLASPVGTKKEAYAIDYQATLNCLNAGRDDRVNANHFVLLSAFCCRRPLLQLQQAKLKFEAELKAQNDMTYSIVRPTAFFKSVSGQLEGIKQGNPYVLFGDGAVTRCNPIAESELAEFMIESITDESRHGRIMNIGGPDEPLTNQMLGEMMYKAIGQEPKFVYAPTWIFDYVINGCQKIADWTGSEFWEDAAETGRIGKYYAVEDMLTTDPAEKYGKISMQDHYNKIAAQGQDLFTPVRATAFIGAFIEALSVIGVAAPIGYALSNPSLLETVEETFGPSASLVVASLDDAASSGF